MSEDALFDSLNKIPGNYELQLVYKLSGIDATLKEFARQTNEKFDRLQSEIVNRHLEMMSNFNNFKSETKSEVARLETKVDTHKIQIDGIVKWKDNMTTKMTMVGVMAFALWAIVGDPIKRFFSGIFEHV